LNRAPINCVKHTTPIGSMRHLDIKPRQPMQHKGFLRHTPSGMLLKKRKAMNNSPPFKRHSVGRTYPWQVAPQQSLLPFRFNNTKFKSVNYIYNLSKFPATFTFVVAGLWMIDFADSQHSYSPTLLIVTGYSSIFFLEPLDYTFFINSLTQNPD